METLGVGLVILQVVQHRLYQHLLRNTLPVLLLAEVLGEQLTIALEDDAFLFKQSKV